MPQMAPYNWLYLFMLFNLIFISITTFNHFLNFKLPYNIYLTNLKFIWKW